MEPSLKELLEQAEKGAAKNDAAIKKLKKLQVAADKATKTATEQTR